MPDKILMNKNTLAALKTELGEYRDALPVFEMKEQQLKGVVQTVESSIERLEQAVAETTGQIKSWVAVLAEEGVELSALAQVERVVTEQQEIAGVAIENFVDIHFAKTKADPFHAPLWVDAAAEVLTDQLTQQVLLRLERKKLVLLREELAEARRMKNALKEVFIPETQESIRKIEIYLGDVERLAIGCAKLVKKKKLAKTASA